MINIEVDAMQVGYVKEIFKYLQTLETPEGKIEIVR